jgi:hypothetical protein
LYVERFDLTASALILDTGAILWQRQFPGGLSGDLTIA